MTPKEYKLKKQIHDTATSSALKHLADKEAAFATERYDNYHSPHEGLAIIEEEVWEAHDAYRFVKDGFRALRVNVWDNDPGRWARESAADIEQYSLHLAQEAIHVAATAQRFLQAMDAGEGEWAHLSTDADA